MSIRDHQRTRSASAGTIRPTFAAAAALWAIGAPPLAGAVLVIALVVHCARSPDRLLDLAYACAFCGLGVLVGR